MVAPFKIVCKAPATTEEKEKIIKFLDAIKKSCQEELREIAFKCIILEIIDFIGLKIILSAFHCDLFPNIILFMFMIFFVSLGGYLWIYHTKFRVILIMDALMKEDCKVNGSIMHDLDSTEEMLINKHVFHMGIKNKTRGKLFVIEDKYVVFLDEKFLEET